MNYGKIYNSPLGVINLRSDGEYLTGLWFDSSHDDKKHNKDYITGDLEIFKETEKWLDIYFDGKEPDFCPKYKVIGETPFRRMVLDIMNKISYGSLITYDDIAREIAKIKNIKKMSAQAVGGAVGFNPICIIIPCHRVIGKNGNLTGYGGGIQNKIKLLELEGIDTSQYTIPKERVKNE